MILAIDATNDVHVMAHAMGDATPDGLAAAVVTRMEHAAELVNASHVVAAFDEPSNFRKELCPTYKANRSHDPRIGDYLAATFQRSAAIATPVAVAGFEADDLLATLAAIGARRAEKVVLASPDKDLRQCLRPGLVTQLKKLQRRGGRSVPTWYCAATLQKEHGLLPYQWPDFQALVGDQGDNITGCLGIGPKTAAALLTDLGTLHAILANPWRAKVTDRIRQALFDFKKRADLVRKLVTLIDNVEGVNDCLR